MNVKSLILSSIILLGIDFQEIYAQTDNTFTDLRDGNVYKTVTIGTQVWMAENLKYLPIVVSSDSSSNTVPYYYVYGYNGTNVNDAKATANYITYGVLYNWPAAMYDSLRSTTNPSKTQGICPTGWHLPSDSEWEELENYLSNNYYNYDGTTGGGRDKIAKSLASLNCWSRSSHPGTVGNTDYPEYRNKSGFSSLPGGIFDFKGRYKFYLIEYYGHWWSSNEMVEEYAWGRFVSSYERYVIRGYWGKELGVSVRCIKD